MHYWVAQRLFEQGEKEQALAIVRQGVKQMRAFIEKREAAEPQEHRRQRISSTGPR